jgi:hypothetical protein
LTKYEPHCKHWVQLSVVKANNIKDLDLRFGYTYFDIIANKEMVEFDIDYWNGVAGIKVHSSARSEGLQTDSQPHGVHQKQATSASVSLKAKPIMIVGQDESIFAQYLLGSKSWVGPKGQRPLL